MSDQSDQAPERLTATDEPDATESEKAGLDEAAARVEHENETGELTSPGDDPDRDVGTAGGEAIEPDLTTPVDHEKRPTRDLSGGGELPTAQGEKAGTGGTA